MKCTEKKTEFGFKHYKGDLDGACYTFLVCINLIWNEAVDPYAKVGDGKRQTRCCYRFRKTSVTRREDYHHYNQ